MTQPANQEQADMFYRVDEDGVLTHPSVAELVAPFTQGDCPCLAGLMHEAGVIIDVSQIRPRQLTLDGAMGRMAMKASELHKMFADEHSLFTLLLQDHGGGDGQPVEALHEASENFAA